MPIVRPGRVLLTKLPLKFVRNRVRGGGRKAIDSSITLVPFIDLLVSLVVFLLASFGANQTSADVRVPDADNGVELAEAPVVVVTPNVVTLDGVRIVDTPSLLEHAATQRIEPLVTGLQTVRNNWVMLHPRSEPPTALILQVDQSVDYRAIRKVVASTSQAGFPTLHLAVQRH